MYFRHDHFRYGGTRGIGFQTAAPTTATQAPTKLDNHMPDLAGSTGVPCIHAPVLYDAGANTGTNEDTDEVGIALTRAVEKFSEGSHFNIVTNCDRLTKLFVEYFTQRHVFDTHVCCIDNDSLFTVTLPCSSNTDCDYACIRRQFRSLNGCR